MRCIPTHLLLAAAFAVCGPCLAQARAPSPQRFAVAAADEQADAQALAEQQAPASAMQPRSAFGRVIAVMISSLQRQARERGRPHATVRTSDAGTPLGIEVGDAFRMGMDDDATTEASAQAASAPATGTDGAATGAGDMPRAAPPPAGTPPPGDYAVRQPALAGPG